MTKSSLLALLHEKLGGWVRGVKKMARRRGPHILLAYPAKSVPSPLGYTFLFLTLHKTEALCMGLGFLPAVCE